MKKFIASIVVVFSMLAAGSALAHGPGGSYEEKDANGAKTNNTGCAPADESHLDVGGVIVYAGANGIDICNDGAENDAVQGRILVGISNHDGEVDPYVAADGDRDNEPEQARGYVRIDQTGVRCDSGPQRQEDGEITDSDASHPNPGADCY